MNCSICGKPLETDNDVKRGICFSCHVKGIRFGFKATGYGQDVWNGPTVREVQRYYEAMPNVEKISTRKELI